MKRIIICADGTWNRPEQNLSKDAPTNVLKVARAIAPVHDGVEQVVFYDWGVGSYYDPIAGGAFGAGIDKNIQDAYRFIVQNYDPGDQLYFFGFSRGAYTVRSLAGFIRNCGILKRTHARLIHSAFELYRARDKHPASVTARRFRKRCSCGHTSGIRFIGVWDTVGNLGVPLSVLGFLNENHLFHDTELSSIVECARHAVSIDETRDDFEPTLWDRKAGIDIKQVWFAGVHADVGGGYLQEKVKEKAKQKGKNQSKSNPVRLLSDIPLNWMIQEAEACGLGVERHVKQDVVENKTHLAEAHDEHEKLRWKFLGTHNRRIRKSDYIHRSAQQRYSQKRSYRPETLTRFIKSQNWQHVREWERVLT